MRVAYECGWLLGRIVAGMRRRWWRLVAADLLFKALAFAVLTPTLAWAWRLYLGWTGQPLLADADIVRFLLHPVGWVALVVLGGAAVSVLALELAVLLCLVLTPGRGEPPGVLDALRAVAPHAPGVFRLAATCLAWLALTAAPFLVAGGLVYRALLTEHDINYYLAVRPPVFRLALGCGVILALGLIGGWAALLTRWAFALPLLLSGQTAARACLRRSAELTRGRRAMLAGSMLLWLGLTWLTAAAVTALTVVLARGVLPSADGALWYVALATGAAMLIWSAGQLLTGVLAAASLAVALAALYEKDAGHPAPPPVVPAWSCLRGCRPRLTPARLTLAAGLMCAAAATVGALALRGVRAGDDVWITAHRGASAVAPENTLAAFEQAIADGADFIELDVQETRDGHVVVVHDSDLMKLGGPPIKVWDATLAELQRVDIGGGADARFRGERIPTLHEALTLARGRVRVNIELKYYGHDQRLEPRVIECVERLGMADQVVVMSLRAEGIARVKRLRPGWTVGLLVAKAVGDLAEADADFLAVNRSLATGRLIAAAHARGKAVHAWTVNDPVVMSSLISRGIDALITDDPALARRVLAERAELGLTERLLVDLAATLGAPPPHAPGEANRP